MPNYTFTDAYDSIPLRTQRKAFAEMSADEIAQYDYWAKRTGYRQRYHHRHGPISRAFAFAIALEKRVNA